MALKSDQYSSLQLLKKWYCFFCHLQSCFLWLNKNEYREMPSDEKCQCLRTQANVEKEGIFSLLNMDSLLWLIKLFIYMFGYNSFLKFQVNLINREGLLIIFRPFPTFLSPEEQLCCFKTTSWSRHLLSGLCRAGLFQQHFLWKIQWVMVDWYKTGGYSHLKNGHGRIHNVLSPKVKNQLNSLQVSLLYK